MRRSVIAPAAYPALARRMARQYYAIMLSGAVVAGVLGAAAAAFSGSTALLPGLLGWLAVALVGANLAGTAMLYRPVYRQLAGSLTADGGIERRLGTLPVLSGLWVFVLAAAATFGNTAAAHAGGGLDAGLLIGAAVHCLVFAAYIGLFTYLLVFDHAVTLRKALWKRGADLRLPRQRFVTRVAWSLGAVALGPVLVALSDGWLHGGDGGPSRPAAANPVLEFAHQTLQLDVLGALFLATVVGLLIARGLSRPMTILLDAMAKVDRGDLSTRAPVISDDEFGSLTRRFNHMVAGLEDRDRLRRAFTYFVPESVAAALIADKGAITPQEREATVLFADIERFTEIASRLAPREVLAMLNDYFAEVAAIINAHGGVITQFQGDAVLACFNLPAADPAHARQAVEAALEIRRRTEQGGFYGGVRLLSRVGVSTGIVVGGMVGGGERLGYTVHGDTVNLAARLEALNKEIGTRILVSARTAELVRGTVALRDLGERQIRGLGGAMHIFTPAE